MHEILAVHYCQRVSFNDYAVLPARHVCTGVAQWAPVTITCRIAIYNRAAARGFVTLANPPDDFHFLNVLSRFYDGVAVVRRTIMHNDQPE